MCHSNLCHRSYSLSLWASPKQEQHGQSNLTRDVLSITSCASGRCDGTCWQWKDGLWRFCAPCTRPVDVVWIAMRSACVTLSAVLWATPTLCKILQLVGWHDSAAPRRGITTRACAMPSHVLVQRGPPCTCNAKCVSVSHTLGPPPCIHLPSKHVCAKRSSSSCGKARGIHNLHQGGELHMFPCPIWLDDRGTRQWKWMEEVPRRTSPVPLAFPCLYIVYCSKRVEAEGRLDYQGRAGIISIARWNLRPVIFGVECFPNCIPNVRLINGNVQIKLQHKRS